ncbi:MAG: penicillin-binding protein 2 [bacterium]|jgi:cell division protein FtsI/penicillin-binding protein 2
MAIREYRGHDCGFDPAILKWRIICASLLMAFFSVFIIAFVVKWQTVDRDKVLEMMRSKWQASYEVPARRGAIRSRGGSLLAISEKTWEVVVDPLIVGDGAVASEKLAELFGGSKEELLARIADGKRKGSRYLKVADGLSQSEMVATMNLNLKGVFVSEGYRRFYPFKDQMSPHTIGFIRLRDDVHFQAESAFDEYLEGEPGQVFYQRDSKWGRIPESTFIQKEVRNGLDVYLTIDENIQIICDAELDVAFASNKAEWGLVSVMDPYTGEILACAVRPTFDPNECVRGAKVGSIAVNPLYGMVVEPGSIIKPIIIAGALDRGYITLDDKYYCPATLKIDDTTVSEAHKGKGFGLITVKEGIIKSSNVLMAQVGTDLGMNKLMEILDGAMLLERPGLGLPTETAGLPPNLAKLDKHGRYYEQYDSDEGRIAFGQGPAMSPLAILTAYAELANGGYAVQPKIILGTAKDVGAALEYAGLARTEYAPFKVSATDRLKRKQVYSKDTVEAVRQALVEVVHSDRGTGKAARLSSGLTVAGKTGTAQIHNPNGKGYLKGQYLSSFVGYFPAAAPRYVVMVMFKNPRGKYYGGEVSAPVFKRVADRICYLDRISPEVVEGDGRT